MLKYIFKCGFRWLYWTWFTPINPGAAPSVHFVVYPIMTLMAFPTDCLVYVVVWHFDKYGSISWYPNNSDVGLMAYVLKEPVLRSMICVLYMIRIDQKWPYQQIINIYPYSKWWWHNIFHMKWLSLAYFPCRKKDFIVFYLSKLFPWLN